MYLLTFATLVIGIIGIYGQILAVQTARIAAQQKGLAQAMLSWHAAAVSMAASLIDNPNATYASSTPHYQTGGCSLSFSTTQSGLPTCPVAATLAGYDTSGTVTDGATPPNPLLVYNQASAKLTCMPMLAICAVATGCTTAASCTRQYDTADYQFSSILYYNAANGGDYVVTFVPPATTSATNPPPGFLTMAGGNMIGFTQSDLAQQLRLTTPPYAYGTVVAGTGAYAAYHVLNPLYNLMPSSPILLPTAVPVNSLAIVASPDGM